MTDPKQSVLSKFMNEIMRKKLGIMPPTSDEAKGKPSKGMNDFIRGVAKGAGSQDVDDFMPGVTKKP